MPWHGPSIDARQRKLLCPGELCESLIELLTQLLIGNSLFHCLLIILVSDGLEYLPDGGMLLVEILPAFVDIGQHRLKMRRQVVLAVGIDFECFVEVIEDAVVINDQAEILALVNAVYACYGLQQGVVLERTREVEHSVSRRIEIGRAHV